MNLVPRRLQARRNPFTDLLDIQREVNDLFDFSLSRWLGRDEGLLDRSWAPSVDVLDSKDSLIVKADLPGLKKDDIEISIQDGMLVVRGEKKQETDKKEKGSIRSERFYGSFYRAVSLPSPVDESKARAAYKNGVLELTLPKREEAKPKQIKVDTD